MNQNKTMRGEFLAQNTSENMKNIIKSNILFFPQKLKVKVLKKLFNINGVLRGIILGCFTHPTCIL
jgi:hypothetical protein